MDNTWKNLAAKLPIQPSEKLKQDVLMDIYDGNMLGVPLILYHRESVELEDEIQKIMGPQDWERWERSRKRRWGARCTCTNCGENFIAGYSKGGIVLAEGMDGQIYDGYVEPGLDANVYFSGETIIATRLAQTSQPSNYPENGRPWVNLSASNVITIPSGSTSGLTLFQQITMAAGAAKGRYSRGVKFWATRMPTTL